jgi:hypothetical protein
MSPPKVSYISPAAEAAAYNRNKRAIEEGIALLKKHSGDLQARLETTLERIKHLKNLAAELEAKHGPRPQGRGATNVKEPVLSKRSSRT